MKTLTEIIYQYKDTEFSWGTYDCCIFAAQIIEEYTGKELPYWKDVITYNDRKGAMKALKNLGCKELKDLPDVVLGTNIKPIEEAVLGDPVYHIRKDTGEGLLGICNGARAYFVKRPKGITALKLEDCEFCWSLSNG